MPQMQKWQLHISRINETQKLKGSTRLVVWECDSKKWAPLKRAPASWTLTSLSPKLVVIGQVPDLPSLKAGLIVPFMLGRAILCNSLRAAHFTESGMARHRIPPLPAQTRARWQAKWIRSIRLQPIFFWRKMMPQRLGFGVWAEGLQKIAFPPPLLLCKGKVTENQ